MDNQVTKSASNMNNTWYPADKKEKQLNQDMTYLRCFAMTGTKLEFLIYCKFFQIV